MNAGSKVTVAKEACSEHACIAPEIKGLAQDLRLTCQELFEVAYYHSERASETYGRAAFSIYATSPQDLRQVPALILEFYRRIKENGQDKIIPQSRAFCMACMMKRETLDTLAEQYEGMYPEPPVLDVPLQDAAAAPSHDLELLWQKLCTSGALEDDEWDVLRPETKIDSE